MDRGRKVENRYLDERNGADKGSHRFNIFWSNVQTLKPAVYAKPPKPIVQRRYLDADPAGRAASTILQRAIATSIEMSDWHETTDQSVMDYLIPGRGVCWARYEPHVRDVGAKQVQAAEAGEGMGAPSDMAQPESLTGNPESETGNSEEGEPNDDGVSITTTVEDDSEITYEEVCWDYINWRDFLHSPARTWQEVRWVGRRVLMMQEEGVERFGAMFKDVPMTWRPEGIDEDDSAFQLFCRARVYEIWNKQTREVVWICPDYGDAPLDVKPDPLKLDGFFPCPRPLYATITSKSLMPRADFVMYQDQANELDTLTQRITKLTQAIKAVGVYDASADGVQRVFNEGIENELIPVAQWNSFQTGGGFKGAVDFLPLDTMAQALAQLVEVREATKRDLYEITGISDIVRGQGMASATATAERIKGQFAQLRLRDRVNEVARFCRDMVRITGEIICKHFQPETLLMMSDFQNSTGATPELAQAAIALLKNDQARGFRIDIEVDSTVIADQQEEQQARVEFLAMAGNFLKEAVPLAMQVPALATLAGQMLLFGVRGFPIGREMEGVFESALEQLAQAQQQPKPEPPPDPAVLEAQAKAQDAQVRLQLDAQKQQQDAQTEHVRLQLEAAKVQLENRRIDLEAERDKAAADANMREHRLKLGEMAISAAESEHAQRAEGLDRDISAVTAVNEAIQGLQAIMADIGNNQVRSHQDMMKAVTAPRRVRAMRGGDGKIAEALSVPEGF